MYAVVRVTFVQPRAGSFCIAFNLNPVVVSRNQVGDYFVIAKIIRVVNVLVVYTAQFSPAAAIPILKCQFCEAEFLTLSAVSRLTVTRAAFGP